MNRRSLRLWKSWMSTPRRKADGFPFHHKCWGSYLQSSSEELNSGRLKWLLFILAERKVFFPIAGRTFSWNSWMSFLFLKVFFLTEDLRRSFFLVEKFWQSSVSHRRAECLLYPITQRRFESLLCRSSPLSLKSWISISHRRAYVFPFQHKCRRSSLSEKGWIRAYCCPLFYSSRTEGLLFSRTPRGCIFFWCTRMSSLFLKLTVFFSQKHSKDLLFVTEKFWRSYLSHRRAECLFLIEELVFHFSTSNEDFISQKSTEEDLKVFFLSWQKWRYFLCLKHLDVVFFLENPECLLFLLETPYSGIFS